MTLFDHPEWPLLLSFLYIRRGHDGVNGPRHRIEVNKHAPERVFAIKVACAHCGATINPVRRDARGAWTFNVSCPLAINPKCARMPEATALASAVRRAMGSASAPEGSLFA